MSEAGPGRDGGGGGGEVVSGPSARTNCEIQAGTERKHQLTCCHSVAAACFDVLTSVLMGLIQLSVSDAAAAAAKTLNAGTLSIYSFSDEQRLVFLHDELHSHQRQ